jgi:hypothetical protein
MFNQLWQSLGGEPIDIDAATPAEVPAPVSGDRQAHGVDAKGNVVAQGAPLLSDIALGKASAPPLIPITTINKKENEEPDG